MQKVLIKGLKKEGPGDIVGAITANTGIDAEKIGNIDINPKFATVEIDEEVIKKVVAEMEGNEIGGTKVDIEQIEQEKEQRLTKTQSYIQKYERLVEMEREEEMRRHEKEMNNLSGKEREEKGRAILNLAGKDKGEGLGGYLIQFTRQKKGEELPDNEISVGDLVMLSKQDPLRDDNPTGTVAEKTKYSITVSFDEKPHGFVFGSELRMDLYVNDITFQRMKEAISDLENASGTLAKLRNIIIRANKPKGFQSEKLDYTHNQNLDQSQIQAVEDALAAKDFYLIHGPPGTGKTTTAIETIQQFVDRGEKVLATAASNTAVDNILEFLLKQDVRAVRIGHPARVTPTLRNHTLDNLVEENPNYQESRKLRKKAFDLKDKQDELTYPSGRYRRGMSNKKIKELAEAGESSRGVSPDKIKEMAKTLELEEKIDDLFDKSRQLEDKAVDEVIRSADVICTTNSTAGSDLMQEQDFDIAVIDEATQATEPSCLIAINHARKVVMAGDHKQLPPTIQNKQAAQEGLETTLFERLANEHGSKIKTMLTTQYRMHEKIMNFSSKSFYNDELEADESVKNHTLKDLDFDNSKIEQDLQKITDPEKPVTFVNITGPDVSEDSRSGSTSKYNKAEASFVSRMIENVTKAGVEKKDLAVITPYGDQKSLIKSNINSDEIEIDTVDGFQGREKEVVIMSLVRSNKKNQIGFLRDIRRLNVAITRAKRKLIVVGDQVTLEKHDVYGDFIEYVSQEGFSYTIVE